MKKIQYPILVDSTNEILYVPIYIIISLKIIESSNSQNIY